MHKRTEGRSLLLLALFLALTAALPAVAQPGDRFELTPHAGYRWLGDLDVDDIDFLDEGFEVDDSLAYGVLLDIPLNDALKLELLASRQASELVATGGLFSGDRVVADIDIDYYQVGLLWQWGSGQTRPFVSGTLGIASLSVDLPGTVDEERFAGTLGGGVRAFFNDFVGLRVEGRGYYVSLDESDDDDDRWRNEDSLVQADVSVGVVLSW